MNRISWKVTSTLVFAFCVPSAVAQSSYDLVSPDKRIEIRIRTAKGVRYDVLLKGQVLLQDCTLSLDIEHKTLGPDANVLRSKERSSSQVLEPVVRQKFAKIHESYNELRLEMDGTFAVVFRAYDEGLAYRFETSIPQEQAMVYKEEANFNFPSNFNTVLRQNSGPALESMT